MLAGLYWRIGWTPYPLIMLASHLRSLSLVLLWLSCIVYRTEVWRCPLLRGMYSQVEYTPPPALIRMEPLLHRMCDPQINVPRVYHESKGSLLGLTPKGPGRPNHSVCIPGTGPDPSIHRDLLGSGLELPWGCSRRGTCSGVHVRTGVGVRTPYSLIMLASHLRSLSLVLLWLSCIVYRTEVWRCPLLRGMYSQVEYTPPPALIRMEPLLHRMCDPQINVPRVYHESKGSLLRLTPKGPGRPNHSVCNPGSGPDPSIHRDLLGSGLELPWGCSRRGTCSGVHVRTGVGVRTPYSLIMVPFHSMFKSVIMAVFNWQVPWNIPTNVYRIMYVLEWWTVWTLTSGLF